MGAKQPDKTAVWARSAGFCCRCDSSCIVPSGTNALNTLIGEVAHIAGENPGSKRYDPSMNQDSRNSYPNLMLLCANCHTIVDNDDATYTVAKLLQMKSDFESKVAGLLKVSAKIPKNNLISDETLSSIDMVEFANNMHMGFDPDKFPEYATFQNQLKRRSEAEWAEGHPYRLSGRKLDIYICEEIKALHRARANFKRVAHERIYSDVEWKWLWKGVPDNVHPCRNLGFVNLVKIEGSARDNIIKSMCEVRQKITGTLPDKITKLSTRTVGK